MRIAIYGTGGVGGYFGGLLAHAGHDVTFLARGPHLQAIQENGLQIKSINGDFHVRDARAMNDPAAVGPVDNVIVAVKHYHLGGIASQMRPLVGPGTAVVTLLNGVDAHEILAAEVGREAVVGGLCSLVSFIEAPGVIQQPSKLRRVVLGELDNRPSERVEALLRAWAGEGVDAAQADDILAALWTKFVFIASLGGIGALTQAAAGQLRSIPETRALFSEAMREVEALARASNVNLSGQVVENALALTDSFEPGATSSMQRDVADGNLFELEAFSGTIVRLGQELGVPTPVHRVVYGLLLPVLERAKGK